MVAFNFSSQEFKACISQDFALILAKQEAERWEAKELCIHTHLYEVLEILDELHKLITVMQEKHKLRPRAIITVQMQND